MNLETTLAKNAKYRAGIVAKRQKEVERLLHNFASAVVTASAAVGREQIAIAIADQDAAVKELAAYLVKP